MVERKRRSIVKAISWRITGTIDTFIVSFVITGTIKLAATISLVEIGTKMFLYFSHERVWNRINFGREVVQQPEYQI